MSLPTQMRYMDHGSGGGPEVIVEKQGPLPVPASGEVLLKVAYAGVEVSGEVVALGAGVTRWKLGDRLCALANGGGYAEYCTVPEGQALPIPQGHDLLQAAALPENFFTVWTNVFERGRLQKGERFLVHGGSSGIGLTAIQLAHAWGAEVFCTVGSEDKAQACRAAGADHAIVYKDQDFVEVVHEITGQQGVNLILDMVGGPYIQRNLKILALEGRLVQIAFLQPSKVEVDWVSLMAKRLTYTGSTLRPRSAADKAAIAQALQQHVWPLLASGQVKPYIYKVFDLSQAAQAHALMETSAHIGKIMMKVGG